MKKILLYISLLLVSNVLIAQTTEYFDTDWNPVPKEKAAYYRIITYDDNGKPIGEVKDYYISRTLQFEGNMLSVNPDTLDGLCIWYYPNGQKQEETLYKQGIDISSRFWSTDGKEEGFLDSSGYFYSDIFLQEYLPLFEESLGIPIQMDSISADAIGRAGNYLLLEEEDYVNALEYFQIAYDLKKRLHLEKELPWELTSIGLCYSKSGLFEEARYYYEQTATIEEKYQLNSDLAISYNNIAFTYARKGDLVNAIDFYDKAKTIQTQFPLSLDLATTLNNIADVYTQKGDYSYALEIYDSVLTIQQTMSSRADYAKTYNNIGTVYSNKGEVRKTIEYYDKARKIQQELGLEENLATSYNNLGGTYATLGALDTSATYYERAIEIQQKLGLEANLSTSYNNFGELYTTMGNFDKALVYYQKALAIRKKLELYPELAITYDNIGELYSSQGKFALSLNYHEKAQNLKEQLGLELNLATTLNNIASNHFLQGNYNLALTNYLAAQAIFEKYEDQKELSSVYNNIGLTLFKQSKFVDALEFHEKSLAIKEKLDIQPAIAASYNNIGQVYDEAGRYQDALDYYKEAQSILESQKLWVDLARLYNNMAYSYDNLKDYDQSVLYYHKAIALQKGLGQEIDLTASYNNLAWNYFSQLQPDSALHYALKNIHLNERLQNQFVAHNDRIARRRNALDPAEIAIHSAYRLYKDSLAFSIVEQTKVRGLADLLAERNLKNLALSPYLKERQDSLNQQLQSINLLLAQQSSTSKRKSLITKRNQLFQKRASLADQIRAISPTYANLVYPKPVTLKTFQKSLKNDEVAVNFYTGYLKTYAFIIRQTQMKIVDLGNSDSLLQLVTAFQEEYLQNQKAVLITNSKLRQMKVAQSFFQISHQLFEKIWQPIEATNLVKGKNIVLTLDGFLNYLPFELLIKDKSQKAFSDYHYLLKDYPLIYTPSLTVFQIERTKDKKKTVWFKDFLGIAVSNFENNRCYQQDSITFSLLPTSQSEVSTIANNFDKARTKLLTSTTNDETNLKALNLNAYRYLHFSTHGLINTEQPSFSRILLTPSFTDDGCLHLYELFDLKLNADLITLSACEMGLGKLERGEGMIGFTRGLMYAGASSIILSLWEVVDVSTKDLFVKYYADLAKASTSKYPPLRAAQLQMIEQGGEYANPYYWAAFIFIGER